jgi:hypothetical protein
MRASGYKPSLERFKEGWVCVTCGKDKAVQWGPCPDCDPICARCLRHVPASREATT